MSTFLGLLLLVFVVAATADARPRRSSPTCKRTKYRYIGEERVPWDHDIDDHDWDEFDHTTDECIPPPC